MLFTAGIPWRLAKVLDCRSLLHAASLRVQPGSNLPVHSLAVANGFVELRGGYAIFVVLYMKRLDALTAIVSAEARRYGIFVNGLVQVYRPPSIPHIPAPSGTTALS